MKPFNLEEALQGKFVQLRNGNKALITFNKSSLGIESSLPLMGLVHYGDKGWLDITHHWHKDGTYGYIKDEFDIIGMYEETQPEVTITFPAPVEGIKSGIEYWTVDPASDDMEIYSLKPYHPDYYRQRLERGFVFKTKKDAQAFLDAMKEARR